MSNHCHCPNNAVIPTKRSEWRNLRTNPTANVNEMCRWRLIWNNGMVMRSAQRMTKSSLGCRISFFLFPLDVSQVASRYIVRLSIPKPQYIVLFHPRSLFLTPKLVKLWPQIRQSFFIFSNCNTQRFEFWILSQSYQRFQGV